ncbi:mechanosensitive ion channel family protein [Desulfosediminicola ganghwensis]|uniref:mechanosensitive ion channel family protein n=1 Tax=Desulfosediminicola ganghwensis TaxID=2569540 RepID=UPI0010ACC43E|nr:mechanosensitive ion channel domain-containing protein [Desulfosediminicola ganghwensis]
MKSITNRNFENYMFLSVLFFLCSISTLVFTISDLRAENAITPSLQAEIERTHEIQAILQILANRPHLEWTLAKKQQLRGYVSNLKNQIKYAESEINQLNSVLGGLGGENGGGSTSSANSLPEVEVLKQNKQLELAQLRFSLLNTQKTLEQLDKYIGEQQSQNLYTRNDPLWLQASGMTPDAVQSEMRSSIVPQKVDLSLAYTAIIITFFLLSALILKARSFITTQCKPDNMVRLLVQAHVRHSVVIRVLYLAICLSVILFSRFQPSSLVYAYLTLPITLVFCSSVIYSLFHAIHARFRQQDTPVSEGPDNRSFSLIVLFFGVATGLLTLFSSSYPAGQLQLPNINLISSCIFILWLIALSLQTKAIGKELFPGIWQQGKYLVYSAILILLVLEVFGFKNLVIHIAYILGATFAVFAFSLILYDSIDILILFLNRQRVFFRTSQGREEKGSAPKTQTSTVLSIGLKIYVIIGAAILTLHQWGITNVDSERLREIFVHGFQLTGIQISPLRVTIALLILLLFWPSIDYIKARTENRLLKSGDFSESSRDTILTITGYICYGALILLMLGVAGVKLTGLTVVVGALSVGIGFGLQNIVNNFISGLILMFEKPIKKGDWILVGSTEGYVKKISIRSTIVQTFDRSDVIVPNSELISNQVTNMMFDDHRGRLRVSVGVAYGSDTELVQKLLLQIAHKHPQVITDGSTPVPKAWFQAFGDSSEWR